MSLLLINVYYGSQILHTATGIGYEACTISVTDDITLRVLRRQIHAGLELLPSQYKISVKARINTTMAGTSYLFNLFNVNSDQIWDMIKTTTLSVARFKTLELVVESKARSSTSSYDPCPDSIPDSSNPVPTESTSSSPVREDPIVSVDEVQQEPTDEEETLEDEWHLDVEEDEVPVDEVEGGKDAEDEEDVNEIVSEWQMSIPFISRGRQHPCAQFNDKQPMSYQDEPFYKKNIRLDVGFQPSQQFISKT